LNQGGATHGRGARGAAELDRVVDRVADGLAEGLVRCRDGRVVWASRRLADLTGEGDPRALEGRPFRELFEAPEEGASADALERALRSRQGPARRVLVVECGPAGEAGELYAITDVTHLRRVEQELLRASRELHRANREIAALRERLRRESAEREQILTVVSHELRTPVTVIAGYNRLLLSERVGALSEEQRRFLHESTKSCQRLSAFIGNLLEAARDVSADGALEVCETSLRPTIEGVAAFLAPLLEEHRLTIALDLDPADTRARFDPLRVEQVLTNLLGNAIKYTRPGGTITISTRPEREEERAMVSVAVEDDGPGVAPADRERIFEPYVRAGEASRAGGLGLGLAICQRIVLAHGGTIRVEDRPGGGSRFVFTLPAATGVAPGRP